MSTALNRLPSIPLGNLRRTLGEVINRATFGGERTIITRNGRRVAAIVSVDDLRLLNELELRADVEELRAMARVVHDLEHVPPVELLAYHALGESKFRRMGQPYGLSGLKPPSEDHLRAIENLFLEAGVRVTRS